MKKETTFLVSGTACTKDKKPPAEAGGLRVETPPRTPCRSEIAQQLGVPGLPSGAF